MEKFIASLPDAKKATGLRLAEVMKKIFDHTFDHKAIKCSEWKGYKFIPMFEAETAKKAYNEFEFEENSIMLASFAKTGTNWTAEVVRQILYGDDEKLNVLSKSIPPPLAMMEMWQPEKLDLLEHIPLPRKLLLTHLPEELVNFEKLKKKKVKVIVIIRNPKDQAVSWFHFSKNDHFSGLRDVISDDWNTFFSEYVQGQHPMITKPGEWYPEYLLGWHKHRDEENVMFLSFEDMKRDPQKEIQRLAKFLEVELTDEGITCIAEATSFDSMKKAASKGGADADKIQKNMNMMRKGQVGSWKETFTVAQSELMDKIVEEKLGGTDIKFTYVL